MKRNYLRTAALIIFISVLLVYAYDVCRTLIYTKSSLGKFDKRLPKYYLQPFKPETSTDLKVKCTYKTRSQSPVTVFAGKDSIYVLVLRLPFTGGAFSVSMHKKPVDISSSVIYSGIGTDPFGGWYAVEEIPKVEKINVTTDSNTFVIEDKPGRKIYTTPANKIAFSFNNSSKKMLIIEYDSKSVIAKTELAFIEKDGFIYLILFNDLSKTKSISTTLNDILN
jgi:hypothetical protein